MDILFSPFSWIVIFMLMAFFKRNRPSVRSYLLLSVLFLLFFSNTFIFDRFMNAWEIKAMPQNNVGNFDGGIVLTGMNVYDHVNDRLEFNDRTDRIMQAISLYKKGKIKTILLSGASETNNISDTSTILLRNYMISIGITAKDIFTETKSKTTHENALMIKPLIESGKKYLLITSGYHMTRALGCFRHEEVDVVPYSADRYSGPVKLEFKYLFVPSSETIFNWEKLIHEWVGIIYYKIRGYM
jgi:uncharacterized SAM-binding protein YcdF (DUF218 family)